MSPKELMAFRLPPNLVKAMREISERERIPITSQIELALEAWLKARGVRVDKTERKRADTRKRS
jgi:hypothetical protein